MKIWLSPALWVGTFFVLTTSSPAAESTNLLKNSGFEAGAIGWSLPKNFTVVNDVVHAGTHSLRLVNTNPASYQLARQPVPFKPGMRYRYGAWIRTRGVKGDESGASLCLEWSGAKGWIGGSYADGKKGDQEWFHLEAVSGPIPTNATSVGLQLYLRKGMTGTAWFDDATLTEEYPPALDAAMLRPNYRGRLDAASADQNVVIRAKVGDMLKGGAKHGDTRLVSSITRQGRPAASYNLTSPKPGDHDLTFDAGSLPAGDYRVQVELLTTAGLRLGSREFELHKLPAAASLPTVFIDVHNRTIVNGKPFFPFGWYFGPGPTTKGFQTHLDRIAASPFNTIMCYGINVGGTNAVREYLDYAAGKGVKIIYSIKDVYEGTRWFHQPVLGWRGEENIVRNVVQTFRAHPALLAWYLNDELPLTMRDRLEARQRLVQQLDPNHPTWAVLYQVGDLFGYLNTADVLGTDPYPIPDKPVTMASDWTRMSSAVSDGKRPLWMVPQAFDWASYRKDPAKGRAPTLDEERVMTYLCLIHGAHGLIYYTYADLLRDPKIGFEQRWADMLVVGREIKQLEPALLSITKPPKLDVKASSEAVHYAVRVDEAGTVYVLAANPNTSQTATIRVRMPGKSEGHLLHRAERQPVKREVGAFEIQLAPMDAVTLIVNQDR